MAFGEAGFHASIAVADVSDVRFAISPVTSEGMNCSRSCHDLATVRYSARNQVLLASLDRDALSINQQCVAAPPNLDHTMGFDSELGTRYFDR